MADKPACYPRKRFASRQAADAAASAIWRRDRKAVTPQRCAQCGGFHLK